MKLFLVFLALRLLVVSGQTWVSRARLKDAIPFFQKALQETVLELERREWCNMKLENITVILNEHMYDWHVAGNVTYANGFVTNIQRIDLANINSIFTTRTVNTSVQALGTVRGEINFRHLQVGFDVFVELEDQEPQFYTGTFTYELISMAIQITKNFHTNEITALVLGGTIRQLYPRMIYLPANNITEVLSRRFISGSTSGSVNQWRLEVIQPILQYLVTTKVEFPSICFVNC